MKVITVKGIGNVSVAPDLVRLSMNLNTESRNYETAMKMAADNIDRLDTSLEAAGFDRKALKTLNFRVETRYESVKRNGSYESVFKGYEVVHELKLEFDFDSVLLSKALTAIAVSMVQPKLNINFTVKDAAAVNEQMLRAAAVNARRKAEVLCEAAGVRLGALQNIDYNWGELDIYSATRYNVMDSDMDCCTSKDMSIEFEPEDIHVGDSATFVWEIL